MGSCVVVSDWNDYLSEAEKQLFAKAIYKDVPFNEIILSNIVADRYKMFKSLQREGAISEKGIFLHDYKNKRYIMASSGTV